MVQGSKFPWPEWVVGRRQAPELTLFEAEAFCWIQLAASQGKKLAPEYAPWPKNLRAPFWGKPLNEDHSILGSVLGPYLCPPHEF